MYLHAFPMNSISLVTCFRLGCFRNSQLVIHQLVRMTISLIGRLRQLSISRLEQLRQLYAQVRFASGLSVTISATLMLFQQEKV